MVVRGIEKVFISDMILILVIVQVLRLLEYRDSSVEVFLKFITIPSKQFDE